MRLPVPPGSHIIWCRIPASNRSPTDYRSVALPNELIRQLNAGVIILYTTAEAQGNSRPDSNWRLFNFLPHEEVTRGVLMICQSSSDFIKPSIVIQCDRPLVYPVHLFKVYKPKELTHYILTNGKLSCPVVIYFFITIYII